MQFVLFVHLLLFVLYTDNRAVVTRGEGESGEDKEGKGSDIRWWKETRLWTSACSGVSDHVLQSRTPEIYVMLLTTLPQYI